MPGMFVFKVRITLLLPVGTRNYSVQAQPSALDHGNYTLLLFT